MLRNMGQICGMLTKSYENECAFHEDVRAWGAPSECHHDVAQGCMLDRIEILLDAEKSTGYTAEELWGELQQRVSSKWIYKSGIVEAFGVLAERREQEELDRKRRKYRNQSRLPDRRPSYYY